MKKIHIIDFEESNHGSISSFCGVELDLIDAFVSEMIAMDLNISEIKKNICESCYLGCEACQQSR